MSQITEARAELAELLGDSGELDHGSWQLPAGVFAPAAEPTQAGVMFLTVLGDELYLLVTDVSLDGGGPGAAMADSVSAGDVLYLINDAGGSYTLKVTGPAAHNAGLGFPYTAVPVAIGSVAGDLAPFAAGVPAILQVGGYLLLGAQVWDHVPEEPQPPCAVLQPADPYLQEDDEATGAGELLLTFDVLLLVELSEANDNATANAQLDALIANALDRIRHSDEWWLVGMDQPQARYTTDWIHHGVAVTVRRRIVLAVSAGSS